jgi:hypothetical protein
MINPSQAEQVLLNKQIKPFYIFKSQLELKNMLQDVIKTPTPLDHVYRFTGGLKAEFLGSIPVEDPNAKNYLASYSKEMYSLLKEIVVLFKEALDYYGLSKDVPFYISSLYSEDIRTDVWYDIGGGGIPCFSGLYFIESDDLGTVKINDRQESSCSGSILLFESGKKIVYDSSNVKVLSFSIAPLSMLERQYPNKWIPIL